MLKKNPNVISHRLKLRDVCNEISERVANPSESEYQYFVGLEHMDSGETRLRRFGSTENLVSAMKLFKTKDILVARRNVYLKRASVAEFDGVCSGDAIVLRPREDSKICLEIIPYLLNTDHFWEYAIKHAAGTMSKRLSVDKLLDYEFNLPPLNEQIRIVQLLLAAEKTAESLGAAGDDARALLRSLSHNQFSLNLEGSQLLAPFYSIVSGQADPKDPIYSNLPLIAPNHIESETGKIIFIETANQQGAISGKYLFDPGAVIYSKIRPNLVKATIAPCKGLCSADMYALNATNKLRNEYLLEILLSDNFTQFAISGSSRTGIPKLNREYLARYKCVVPEMQKQDEYISRVRMIRSAELSLKQRKDEIRKFMGQVIIESIRL